MIIHIYGIIKIHTGGRLAQNMDDIFKVTDQRGFTVHCTVEVWYNHIVMRHPWMEGSESEVADGVAKANAIYQDRLKENRNIYYHRRNNPPRYIKVVVDFDEKHVGSVVTAFPADSPKPGEKWIWPQSSD